VALELAGVSYTYGAGTAYAQRAVHRVDLEIAAGSITLIAGATGSGKSTLLRIAAGLIVAEEGAVRLDGERMAGPRAAAGGVGIVFQSPESQLFAETVLDDVAFGPRNQGHPTDRALLLAREALSGLGLDPKEFAARSPFALSGGEARRAALAGVLAMQPRYLLLDEPTAGLDAAGRSAVTSAIERMRARAGIAIVSHDLESFMPIANRALVLVDGATAFFGEVAELIARPDVLTEASLRPPAVLLAQCLARTRGATIPALTLDPDRAAEALAKAMGIRS
jgi:energy-coupling factor transport system ATP-binding protein